MNDGGWKHGEPSTPEEREAKWLAKFEEWGEDTLREYMKDPSDPTSPDHPRNELAVEWLGKREKAKARDQRIVMFIAGLAAIVAIFVYFG